MTVTKVAILISTQKNIVAVHHIDIFSSQQLYDKSAQSGTLLCFTYASFVSERVEIISVPPKMAPVIKETISSSS